MESGDENKDKICTFCLKNKVKYTCPRCNIQYCSSSCYKCEAHSECSETFYKDCFMQGLKEMGTSPGDKRKVMEMLQRIHSENLDSADNNDNNEEDTVDDLHERMLSLNIDVESDKVWSVLTDSEKAEFKSMLKDGRMSNLIDMWHPWWVVKPSKILEIDTKPKEVEDNMPKISSNISDIGSILKLKTPSKDTIFSVINILYGYAYICRLYNGDHMDMSYVCTQHLQKLCGAIRKEVYTGASEAIYACKEELQTKCNDIAISPHFTTAVIEDVIKIIHGKGSNSVTFILAALSDLHLLFSSARKEVSKKSKLCSVEKEKEELKREKQSIYACEKKLEFLLSYVKSCEEELFNCFGELEAIFCSMTSELSGQSMAEALLEKNSYSNKNPGKKLVEEL